MLLSIVAIIIISLFLLFCLIIVAPLTFDCTCQYDNSLKAKAVLSYIHPLILKCNIDTDTNIVTVFLFHRIKIFSCALSDEEEKADSMKSDNVTTEAETVHQESSETHKEETHTETFTDNTTAQSHTIKQTNEKTEPRQNSADKKSPKETKKSGFFNLKTFKRIFVFIGNAQWRSIILVWLKKSVFRFFRVLSVPLLSAHIKAGFDDPSKTGIYFGYYIAGINMLANINNKRRHIVYEPDFTAESFSTHGQLRVSTSIVRLVLPFVLAIVTFPYLRTIRLIFRARKIH